MTFSFYCQLGIETEVCIYSGCQKMNSFTQTIRKIAKSIYAVFIHSVRFSEFNYSIDSPIGQTCSLVSETGRSYGCKFQLIHYLLTLLIECLMCFWVFCCFTALGKKQKVHKRKVGVIGRDGHDVQAGLSFLKMGENAESWKRLPEA